MGDVSLDPKVVIPVGSLACYLIYKQYEPDTTRLHFLLLVVAPATLAVTTGVDVTVSYTVSAILAYWALLVSFTVLYRLSPLHPLAKYPGPLLAKTSNLYHVYVTVGGKAHLIKKSWHDRYGDVVRIGPNELSFNRADAVYPILGARKLQKGGYYNLRVTEEGLPIDAIKDFDVHAIRRKPWTRAFAPKAVVDYHDLVLSRTGLLMSKLSERVGQTIDMSTWMSYYGFDFMGQLTFAREFGMLDAGADTEGLWGMIKSTMSIAHNLSLLPWITPILLSIPGSGTVIAQTQKIAAGYARHRVSVGTDRKDLWYHLTGEEGERRDSNLETATADAFTAVIAGAESTATSLSHFWYFMMRYPECCERLYEEIRANFPGGEQPSDFERLAAMPYLNACINESFRLISPILSGIERNVAKDSEGATIGPYFVPPGTDVSVHCTSLYRNPEAFSPLPDTFWPDRWLEQDTYVLPTSDGAVREIPRSELKLAREAFHPFSAGPQSCPAKPLAMLELRYIVALVLQKFVIHPADGYNLDRWEEDVKDFFAALRGPLMVTLELRQSK